MSKKRAPKIIGSETLSQGIADFKVVKIGDVPATALPANIYVSHAQTPAQAARDMRWMMQQKHIDYATWVPGEDLISQDLKDRIADKMKENPNFFNFLMRLTSGGHPLISKTKYTKSKIGISNLDSSLSSYFNRITLSKEDKDLLKEWQKASIDILKDFMTGLKNSMVNINIDNGNFNGRNLGNKTLDMHVDVDETERSGKTNLFNDNNLNPLLNIVRVLWSQNDIGTFVADKRDWVNDYTSKNRKPSFINACPTLYAADPWSISMSGWSMKGIYDGVAHSSPVSARNLERILWDIMIKFARPPSQREYRSWVDNFNVLKGAAMSRPA